MKIDLTLHEELVRNFIISLMEKKEIKEPSNLFALCPEIKQRRKFRRFLKTLQQDTCDQDIRSYFDNLIRLISRRIDLRLFGMRDEAVKIVTCDRCKKQFEQVAMKRLCSACVS